MDDKAVWILFTNEQTSLDDCMALRSLKSKIKPGDTVYVYSMSAGKILYRTTVTELGQGARYNLLELHIDERYLGKGLRTFGDFPSVPMDKTLMDITENSPLLKHIQSEFDEGQERFQARNKARESKPKKTSDFYGSHYAPLLIIIAIIGIPILVFSFTDVLFGIVLFIGLGALIIQELTRGKL